MRLKDAWKGLPGVSLIRFMLNPGKDESDLGYFKLIRRLIGHSAYAGLVASYTVGAIADGTLNPVKIWEGRNDRISESQEKLQRHEEESQRYEELYEKAFGYANSDGVEGLSLNELEDLLTRAGRDIIVNVPKGKLGRNFYVGFKSVELTTEDLERAVESYESGR